VINRRYVRKYSIGKEQGIIYLSAHIDWHILIVIPHATAKPRRYPVRIIERALTDFRSRLLSSDRGDGGTIAERRPEGEIKR